MTLQPNVLRWARVRARLDPDELAEGLKVTTSTVLDWEATGRISIAQVDDLARHTHTPLGYLYLDEPPEERLPIADFRTRGNDSPSRPSPNLLETIFRMQRRQIWMSEQLVYEEFPPLDFVASHNVDSSAPFVASDMAKTLRLNNGWAAYEGSWSKALRFLRDRIEDAGVLVFFNGVVGNNTSRTLDPNEFQGFALVDEYAPLIFVNNADYKAAQIFTLVHELAHLFVGEAGLSRFERLQHSDHEVERLCDKMTAEFLVPEHALLDYWELACKTANPYNAVAREFKVSTIVAARRALDTGLITQSAFYDFYEANKSRGSQSNQDDIQRPRKGHFWNNQHWRLGRRFATEVFHAVTDGRLTYREAYELTDLHGDTFSNMPVKMGLQV